MQVANKIELTTSATLGGGPAMAFGVTEDPAFFHILSTSLYNNPNLAVIRETMCNSWDAHIEAGITNRPIEIAIDKDNFLTFRDFGSGIPADKIQEVYGMYGASTKKNDSRSTGGFGLGCKSPFSIVDSFQVTSWNQGIMSVYNVTKSSVETDGKPGIIPVVTGIPTTESGLEVKIQVPAQDVNELSGYITSIAYNGEIRANLTRVRIINDGGLRTLQPTSLPLKNLGMSFEPGSYDISDSWFEPYMGHNTIFVRYGNVMYPIIESPNTHKVVNVIKNFISIIGARNIVIQAKPDSLAIAPSRETLSNQKMTDDGLVDLCVELAERLEKDIKARIPAAISEIEEGIKGADNGYSSYPNFVDDFVNDEITARYMRSSLWRKQRTHHGKKWMNKMDELYLAHPAFKGLRFNYNYARKTLRQARLHSLGFRSDFIKKVVRPAVYRKELQVRIGEGFSGYIWGQGRSNTAYTDGHLFRNLSGRIRGKLGILHSKDVVITRRINGVETSFFYYPGNTEDWFTRCANVYVVSAKKGADEEAEIALKAKGYNVINLLKQNDWDKPTNRRKEEAKERADAAAIKRAALLAAGMEGSAPNRLVSIRCLEQDQLTLQNGKYVPSGKRCISRVFAKPENWKKHSHVDVETPKYYIEVSDVYGGAIVPGNRVQLTAAFVWEDITDEIKDSTVVCRNKIEVNKAIKRGAVHLDYLMYQGFMEMINSKEFKKYATQYRRSILDDLNIEYGTWRELFDKLGIKHKVFDSLVVNEKFDWAHDMYNRSYRNLLKNLLNYKLIEKEADLSALDELFDAHHFKGKEELRVISRLFHSSVISGPIYYSSEAGLLEWLDSHPEDISAYKTIIRNCLKRKV